MARLKNFVVKYWKIITILVVILAVFLFIFFRGSKNNIKIEQVKKGNIQEELILSGEISAVNYAKLSFETSGKIVYVGVKEGDKVSKGKLVSKIDATVLNSSYQSALATLRMYDATVENIHDQVKGNDDDESFAQKDLRTTAEAIKDKAYEAVVTAKKNLDGANLYAPFSGIITYLAHPFVGVYTSLGAVEAEIIDPSTMYFSVLADQTEVIKLFKGQKVIVVLDSFEDKEFVGIVDNISFTPKLGEAGSVYALKVLFININLNESLFKIAMTGDAKFIISEKRDVLYVPNNYVKTDKNGKYLKTDKKKGKIYIETGIESEDSTEVKGDIKEGLVVYD